MWLHADIKSLADIPRYHAKKSPTKTALKGNGRSLTFQELDASTNRVANAIVKIGIPRLSHVSFLGKNSIEYLEVLFGANKAGCAMLPLNWRASAAELAAVIDDANTPLVIVDKEYAGLLEDVQSRASTRFMVIPFDSTSADASPLRELLASVPDTDPKIEIHPEDTALLMYTSGTTGKPKGVQMSQGGLNYMRLCEHLEPAYQWEADDVMMFVMPNFHLVGTGLTVQALYNGVTITILPALVVPEVLRTIAEDRPSICCLVPTAIQMLLDHPEAKNTDFSSLRMVWYAGSSITSQVLKRAMLEMKCKFMQFYGATESCGALTLLRPEQHVIEDEQKLKSCGTALPLIEIRIVDQFGEEVGQGDVGEFLVRAPSLFKGYWKQPEATEAALQDGWYRSGDVGYKDAEGLFYIVDRAKDMIVSGGENIYSTEVEQALVKHPAVAMTAVFGVPDEQWGERVTAVVVLANGKTVTEEELFEHCRTLIARYKVPKKIIFADQLPMTPTGKIKKTSIRSQYGS